MCKVTRGAGEGNHWLVVGCKTAWAPEICEVVTTKRAIYAAFVGPIPENMDVVSTCDVGGCVRPEHVGLAAARRASRALSLPETLATLSRTGEEFAAVPGLLPKGVTARAVAMVKRMSTSGTPLAAVSFATGLSAQDVARSRGGAYDEAVKNARGAKGQSAAALLAGGGIDQEVVGPVEEEVEEPPAVVEVEESGVVVDEVEESEEDVEAEEAVWLANLGRR